jgi:hypothetical protein
VRHLFGFGNSEADRPHKLIRGIFRHQDKAAAAFSALEPTYYLGARYSRKMGGGFSKRLRMKFETVTPEGPILFDIPGT